MNNSNQDLEPGWATYLKTFAFVVPGLLFWMGACVFVAPKMKQVCAASGTSFPGLILTVLALSDFLRNNLIFASVLLFTILALLEWRSQRWPRYRRKVFGLGAFILNFGALFVITAMLIFAVIGGANLLPHAP